MEYGATAHNRSVYASPPVGGSASGFARSATPPTAHSTHSLSALEMLRISLFGPPNRRQQPERYAQYPMKFIKKIKRGLTKNMVMI
jgi:hypothetical protein